ncbi:MAG: PA14 domain-containing protein [Saprospiraceae bacterium]
MNFPNSHLNIVVFLLVANCLFAQPQRNTAANQMTTPWTDKVSPENALPEYPRPQMTRSEWINLNGEWNFTLTDRTNENVDWQGKILVPYPVESLLSGVQQKVKPNHLMAYQRTISIPRNWQGQRILLHFGAVDYQTQVFLNGKKIGEHTGGYDPFSFDLTNYLNLSTDEQILTVQVTDPTDTGGQPIGKQRLDPSGIWYTATSGIWQTVWLEPVANTYISSFRVEPDIDKKRILVRVETAGDRDRSTTVTARILENGQELSTAKGKAGTPLLLQLRKGARLWSPDDPYLYDIEISLGDKKSDDRVNGYFGMRKTSIGKDKNGTTCLLLNNEPVFQVGVLDQGFFPDGLYTPPTEAAMQYDLQSMKDMGFNMIRKHVKVEPARWYHLCDKMGLLVWQDMPSAANTTDDDRQQFKWELKAMVDHLFNFPSIVMWVPFNEGWGQHETEFYVEKMKVWDPTRLVNNASGWTDAGVGDVLDIHAYPGPAAPPKEEDRAIVLGEFGGLGLNVRGHQWTDMGWGYQLIETPEDLLSEYEHLWHQLHRLQDTAGLSAVVYTQLSDIETENNGLLTYDRKVTKMEPSIVKMAHRGQLPPIPKNDARIFVKNTTVELSTYAPGATIQYSLNGLAPDAEWKTYAGPISLKKSATIHCRSSWPDGIQTHPQAYHFQKIKPLKSKVPKGAEPGFSVKVFNGSWEKLPDFNTLTAAEKVLTVKNIDLTDIGKEQHYAALFEGFIEIAETGVYTFHLSSDDGSQLQVANQLLIDNDGLHGMKPMAAHIALKKGKHPVRLAFFQNEGDQGLEFWIVGPTGKRVN